MMAAEKQQNGVSGSRVQVWVLDETGVLTITGQQCAHLVLTQPSEPCLGPAASSRDVLSPFSVAGAAAEALELLAGRLLPSAALLAASGGDLGLDLDLLCCPLDPLSSPCTCCCPLEGSMAGGLAQLWLLGAKGAAAAAAGAELGRPLLLAALLGG